MQNQLKPNYNQKIKYSNNPIIPRGHFEQIDRAIAHSNKVKAEDDAKSADTPEVPDNDETFYEDETELTEDAELWNKGRKVVHNLSDYVAYKLNCYNDRATKWMVKQGKQYIACVDTLEDVLNVFEAQFA